MSAEFTAKFARELTNKNDNLNTEKWYSVWKDKFFNDLQKEALRGNSSFTLESDQWESSEHNKRYLISKLESLGYKVNVSKWDHEEIIVISW